MYKVPNFRKSSLEVNQSKQGETIEQKMERIVHQNEPIKDGAPRMYFDRKEGVRPETNIRTDRFEVAIEAMSKVEKSYKARREESPRVDIKVVKDEPIQGEDGKTATK